MEHVKVLYADIENKTWEEVKVKLEEDERFECLSNVGNGADLVKSIYKDKPDIVIVDSVLPLIDGLGVIEIVMNNSEIDKKPKFIMTTVMTTTLIINKAYKLGVELVMAKPLSINNLVNRIKDVAFLDDEVKELSEGSTVSLDVKVGDDDLNPNKKVIENPKNHREVLENMVSRDADVEQGISDILYGLGIPSHTKGYLYLKEAIRLVCEDEKYLDGVTKALYPKVAEKFETTPQRAERSIRNAIEITFNKRKKDILDEIFVLSPGKTKPVNSEFIAVIADKVRDRME